MTRQLKVNKEVDFWDELPDELKNEIEEATKEADCGEVFSHESVLNEMKANYNIQL